MRSSRWRGRSTGRAGARPCRGRLGPVLLAVALLSAACGSNTTPTPSAGRASFAPAPSTVGLPGLPSVTTSRMSASPAFIPSPSPVVTSDVPRTPPDPAQASDAAASIAAFGVDVFRHLVGDQGLATKNAVFSPTSIAMALAMVRAGAKGETASQIDRVLHTSGWDALGPGLNSLDQGLAALNSTWTDWDGVERSLALRIANGAYGQSGWTIERPFLDAIAAAFGAGLRLIDFAADPDAARQAINAWVSDQTAGRIPSLLDQRDVTDLTRLVLVDAVYLKAAWEIPFRPEWTTAAPFTRLDGTTVDVPTMHTGLDVAQVLLPYVRGNGWQAVQLRYAGQDHTTPLAMTLILPDDLASFEASLSANELARIDGAIDAQRKVLLTSPPCPAALPDPLQCGCSRYGVALYLPRFSIDTRTQLRPVLSDLGMPLAFNTTGADFSGIHVPDGAADRVYVSAVVHEANIDVDEKGTTAAAATALLLSTGGGCGVRAAKTITLRFDRPFLFVLSDTATGAILFMGHVTDPSAAKGT